MRKEYPTCPKCGRKMRPVRLRLFGEYRDGMYHAYCVDFDLIARGKTLEESIKTLHEMITSYIDKVNELDSPGHLVRRTAPFGIRMRFYRAYLCTHLLPKLCGRKGDNQYATTEKKDLCVA